MQIGLEQICCFWNKAKHSWCEITLKQDEVDNNEKKSVVGSVHGW